MASSELVQKIEEQTPAMDDVTAPARTEPTKFKDGEEYGVYFAQSQIKGTCAWLFGADGHLDIDCFRAAARKLVERHKALHYGMVRVLRQPRGSIGPWILTTRKVEIR